MFSLLFCRHKRLFYNRAVDWNNLRAFGRLTIPLPSRFRPRSIGCDAALRFSATTKQPSSTALFLASRSHAFALEISNRFFAPFPLSSDVEFQPRFFLAVLIPLGPAVCALAFLTVYASEQTPPPTAQLFLLPVALFGAVYPPLLEAPLPSSSVAAE